jgi:hypothetical protein
VPGAGDEIPYQGQPRCHKRTPASDSSSVQKPFSVFSYLAIRTKIAAAKHCHKSAVRTHGS